MFDQSHPCRHARSGVHAPVPGARARAEEPRKPPEEASCHFCVKSEKSPHLGDGITPSGEKERSLKPTLAPVYRSTQELLLSRRLWIHTSMDGVVVGIKNQQRNSGLAVSCSQAKARRLRLHALTLNRKQLHSET